VADGYNQSNDKERNLIQISKVWLAVMTWKKPALCFPTTIYKVSSFHT